VNPEYAQTACILLWIKCLAFSFRIQKRTHNPLLVAAECDKTNIAVPWLGGKRLRLSFG